MTSFAIVVGINEYLPRTGQRTLDGAVDDACDFADWVLDPAGGDVARENLFFWTHPWPGAPTARLQQYLQSPTEWEGDLGPVAPNPDYPPKAREIVETALQRGHELAGLALVNGSADHRIYVFLAGHGVRTHEVASLNSQTCFLAGDFHSTSGNTAFGLVPCESFRKSLLASGFREVFMFLDCCRVQDPILPMPAAVMCGAVNEPPLSPWGVGNAAQDGKEAFEVAGPPPRGAFSLALIEGLRTHRDPTNALPIGLLKTFVADRIQTKSRGQSPAFLYNPADEPGPVIVTGGVAPAGPHPSLTLDLSYLPAGTRLRLLGRGLMTVPGFEDFPAGPALLVIPNMPPDLYQVERLDGTAELAPFRHPRGEPIRVG